MSTFGGINSALTALRAHRATMDVIGQNIANVNTPGYTRQRAELEEVNAPGGSGMISEGLVDGRGGVRVATISRAYDVVQSTRVNTQTGDHALQQQRAQTLSSLESLTQEPSDAGLSKQLDKMWSAWADASTKVGSTGADAAARQNVIGTTQNVVTTLNAAYGTVDQQWTTTASQVQADVTEVNALATDVATLNEQIQKAITTGGAANELMDKRDQKVTRIVELTGANTQASTNGQVDVYLGGGLLVQGSATSKLAVTTPSSMADVIAGQAAEATSTAGLTPAQLAARQTLIDKGTVSVTIGLNAVNPTSGQLAGEVEALRTTLPGAARSYDAIADTIATQVNALQLGATAVDANGNLTTKPLFTDGTSGTGPFRAQSLQVNASITSADLGLGLKDRGGRDGSNAAAVAALSTATTSPDRMWSSYVSGLGAASSSASSRAGAAAAVLTASIADQQGSAGVNLDEESADLIAAQRAYQGAARVLTAVDEMLDTLINKTGLVGR